MATRPDTTNRRRPGTVESTSTAAPRPKRWKQRVRKYTVRTLGVLGIAALVIFLAVSGRELRHYVNSGTVFGLFLALTCFSIVRKHKRLLSPSAIVMAWRVYGFTAIAATVVLYLFEPGSSVIGSALFFPLFVFMVLAFFAGLFYAIKLRKDADATFTGELYLIASTLTFVVTTYIGQRLGMGWIQGFGHFFAEVSFVFLAIAVYLLIRVTARRPDLVYDDEVDNTPDDLIETDDREPHRVTAAHPDDDRREPHGPYVTDDDGLRYPGDYRGYPRAGYTDDRHPRTDGYPDDPRRPSFADAPTGPIPAYHEDDPDPRTTVHDRPTHLGETTGHRRTRLPREERPADEHPHH